MPKQIQSVLLDAFEDRLRYGFSTKPFYVAGTEADAETLRVNRQHWLNAFDMNPDTDALAFPTQIHGDEYFAVSQQKTGDADAILLDAPHHPAVVFSADCTPIILYAPDVHLGAVVHCGWKSTALGLAPKMVKVLAEKGANPNKLVAVIAPALSLDGFEIELDPLQTLRASVAWESHRLWYRKSEGDENKYHADIPFLNELQLRHAGVRCIERLAYSTDGHPSLFWSFRQGDWQRQGTFLELL